MPYKSRAQAAKFHILEKQGKISPATVKEFDQATDFSSLPKRVSSPATPRKRLKPRRSR